MAWMDRVKATSERFTARQRCIVGAGLLVAWLAGTAAFPGVDLVFLYVGSMLMFFGAVTVRINKRP
ncbi:hypothetical protein PUR31_02740 [Pseudomonas mosselii]|uniref:hypothetical protein n=1 Tax=unclassified Pseudomonas TaxID=196821 RepID=UPI0019418EF9|nr:MULTISPECIES: hypothetical protein [unclassified Pseudomonas]MCP8632167.1 hypothetical protein [Pseudomonas sp. DVZ6]MDD7783004.1 hypothetical protein [Pseudomonas sp. DVZ24]BDU09858.1 hypothetical protein PRtIB026_A30860 [Pseudomonas sp. RtIB026]